jgi:hypothetical protein
MIHTRYILFLLLLLNFSIVASAQFGFLAKTFMQSAIKTEVKLFPKQTRLIIQKETQIALASIAKSRTKLLSTSLVFSDELLPNFRNVILNDNLEDGFLKILKDQDINPIDIILEMSQNAINEDFDKQYIDSILSKKYIDEIFQNKNFPILYKELCIYSKKDTLSNENIFNLLTNNKRDSITLDSITRYNIYFTYSNFFAIKQLNQLKKYYNCDKEKSEKIDALAEKRGIKLISDICNSSEEETSLFESILGLIILLLIFNFFRKQYIKFTKKKKSDE